MAVAVVVGVVVAVGVGVVVAVVVGVAVVVVVGVGVVIKIYSPAQSGLFYLRCLSCGHRLTAQDGFPLRKQILVRIQLATP